MGLSVLSIALAVMIAMGWFWIHYDFSKWGKGYTLHRPPEKPVEPIEVSVVIPARNEAHNIQACIQSLLNSEGVRLQIIVVDDGSTDDTRMIVHECTHQIPNVSVVALETNGDSWSGKSRACWEGSTKADNDWLLFIDADVRVHSKSLMTTCRYAQKHQVDLLSLFGTWELVSFWERMLIPAIGWFIRGTIGLADVNKGGQAFANGQYMLFSRAAYLNIGGHQSVRGAVLDDVGLARVMHESGHRLALLWGPWCFRVRLYRHLTEIVGGYSKNLFEGMGRRYSVGVVSMVFLLGFTVLPVILVVLSVQAKHVVSAGCWALCVFLMIVFRYRLERRDSRKGAWWVALLHPISVVLFSGIILNSMVRRTVRWKGRVFEDGKMRP